MKIPLLLLGFGLALAAIGIALQIAFPDGIGLAAASAGMALAWPCYVLIGPDQNIRKCFEENFRASAEICNWLGCIGIVFGALLALHNVHDLIPARFLAAAVVAGGGAGALATSALFKRLADVFGRAAASSP